MTKAKSRSPLIQPRIRVRVGHEVALGPGKIELLELVEETGSITNAARKMGMSYMRAWTLIRTMNRCFKEPVVSAIRGGSKGGGGAKLTKTGRQALALYQKMETRCLGVMESRWKELQKLLRA